MIFIISTGDTNKMLHSSNVRPDDPSSANIKSDILNVPTIVKSVHSSKGELTFDAPPIIDEEDETLHQLTPRK